MKKSRFATVVIALSLAATLVLAGFALVGCSSGAGGASSAGASGASGASSGTKALVIGFDPEYPPYGYIAEDGSYAGFDIDLAAAAAEANGWTFEAKPIDWDERDAELDFWAAHDVEFCTRVMNEAVAEATCYMRCADVSAPMGGSWKKDVERDVKKRGGFFRR